MKNACCHSSLVFWPPMMVFCSDFPGIIIGDWSQAKANVCVQFLSQHLMNIIITRDVCVWTWQNAKSTEFRPCRVNAGPLVEGSLVSFSLGVGRMMPRSAESMMTRAAVSFLFCSAFAARVCCCSAVCSSLCYVMACARARRCCCSRCHCRSGVSRRARVTLISIAN